MRLDFNILWVEDQPDQVKAQRARIDYLLRKEGFRVNAEFATSVGAAEDLLGSDIFGDHVDLVLMDFDLGGGPNGSVGIERVRDLFPFKDIVFYSASGVQRLQQTLADGKFQGIFYSSREDLTDTVFGVFEALVKKVLDIEHARGIVMGATSEIDHFINQSLIDVCEQGEGVREAALKLVIKQISDNRKTYDKEVSKIEVLTDLSVLADFHHIFTSAHRLRLLRKLLQTLGAHNEECEAMIKYADETIPRRNDLAHVRVVREGFSRKLFDRHGNQVTADDMRDLRVALLAYHELFEKVTSSLSKK